MSTRAPHNKAIKSLPKEGLLEMVTDLFRTLGDTTRAKILYSLQKNELCVKDLAELTGISQSGISHQLSYLRKLKFVKARKDGNTAFYSLRYKHLSAILKEAEYYADHVKRNLPDHPYR
jgi:DNA-binding transcriptional ArsR family regulator